MQASDRGKRIKSTTADPSYRYRNSDSGRKAPTPVYGSVKQSRTSKRDEAKAQYMAFERADDNRFGRNGRTKQILQRNDDRNIENLARRSGNNDLLERVLQNRLAEKTGAMPKWALEKDKKYNFLPKY